MDYFFTTIKLANAKQLAENRSFSVNTTKNPISGMLTLN